MESLAGQIARSAFAPYVYAYPPTRSYRPVRDFPLEAATFTPEVNLYVHSPFCEQKCSFCGYFVVADPSGHLQDAYVDALIAEIRLYRQRGILAGKTVTSVNFGGGTPSLLTVPQLARLFLALANACPSFHATAQEISIEATPESVSPERAAAWLGLGIRRVSLGVQSFDAAEIAATRRHNLPDVSRQALETLRTAGIPNVCCDLMYGLDGQTLASWEASVRALASEHPETVELYAAVPIPGTAFARRSLVSRLSSAERVRAYGLARELLLDAGYAQDCHLRFILPGRGGYRQQENVFHGQSLIGFGVSARSYATDVHYRNAPIGRGIAAVHAYIEGLCHAELAANQAAILSADEQARRYLIYQLEHLDFEAFEALFGAEARERFSPQIQELVDLSLAVFDGGRFRLTAKGLAFRDLIAASFFSDAVRATEQAYYAQSSHIG